MKKTNVYIYMKKTNLIKGHKQSLNKGKDTSHSWVGRWNITKLLILPKEICKCDTITMIITQFSLLAEETR